MWLPLNAIAASVSSTAHTQKPCRPDYLLPGDWGGQSLPWDPLVGRPQRVPVGAGRVPASLCRERLPQAREAPHGSSCCRALPPAVGAPGFRKPPRERAGPTRVLLLHRHSAVQPGVCWQRIISTDVLYNLPAHRLKIMTVFRANDQPGVAGGRCNTGRLGAMPTAFHRCPAHTALPASPPVTRGNLLGSFSLC